MVDESRSVIEALDRIRVALESSNGDGGGVGDGITIDYPQIANGPVEQVLAFNNDEYIKLEDATGDNPYFSSHGVLTDLQHRELPGSKVETTFPVDRAKLPDTIQWPPVQEKPWDAPPLDPTHTLGHGYSKQAYFFNGGADSLVTVGPSLPKIAVLKNGGAQFWVASIGVIAQGTGKYKGARGTSVYIGSTYLEAWPPKLEDQIKILAKGFKALVGTYFKLVLKKDHAAG